jgi:threonyl-tRNA synthetase
LVGKSTELLSLKELRCSASRIVMMAFKEIFPSAQLLCTAVSDCRFSLDLSLSPPPEETLLPLLEQKVQGLIKEEREVELLEMAPVNAAQYLDSLGEEASRKKVLEQSASLVTLMRCGRHVLPCPVPFIQSTAEIPAIKLLSMTVEGGVVHLEGMLHYDQKSLKSAVKRFERAKKFCHQSKVQERQLALSCRFGEETKWLLLPAILGSVDLLRERWQELQELRGTIEVLSAGSHSLVQEPGMRLAEWRTSVEEREFSSHGLLDFPVLIGDYVTSLSAGKQLIEDVEETLSSITDFLRPLGLELELVVRPIQLTPQNRQVKWKPIVAALKKAAENLGWTVGNSLEDGLELGPALELRALDARGEGWTVSRIVIALYPQQDVWLLTEQWIVSATRFIALLLESNDARLPVWLSPVQVMLVPEGPEQALLAETLAERLEGVGASVGIDLEEVPPGDRIRYHEKVGIPYTCVLGAKEAENATIAVYSPGKKKSEVLSWEPFIQKLKQDMSIKSGA